MLAASGRAGRHEKAILYKWDLIHVGPRWAVLSVDENEPPPGGGSSGLITVKACQGLLASGSGRPEPCLLNGSLILHVKPWTPMMSK